MKCKSMFNGFRCVKDEGHHGRHYFIQHVEVEWDEQYLSYEDIPTLTIKRIDSNAKDNKRNIERREK